MYLFYDRYKSIHVVLLFNHKCEFKYNSALELREQILRVFCWIYLMFDNLPAQGTLTII
jgi:hypothetical protein